jgi:hypothetical protein
MSAILWPLMPPFSQAQESGALSMQEASQLEDFWMNAPEHQVLIVPEQLQEAAGRLVFFEMTVHSRLQ